MGLKRDLTAVQEKLRLDLIRLRKEAGLSQQVLASKMGKSQSTIGRIESGMVIPDLKTVSLIANALGYEMQVEFKDKL